MSEASRERERRLFIFATGETPPRAEPPEELLPLPEINSLAKGLLPVTGCCGLPLAGAIAGVALALGTSLRTPWLLGVAGGALALPGLFLAANNVLANTQRFEWRRRYRNFLMAGEVREARVVSVSKPKRIPGVRQGHVLELELAGANAPETGYAPLFWQLDGARLVHPSGATVGAGDAVPVLQDPTDPTLFGVLWGKFEV